MLQRSQCCPLEAIKKFLSSSIIGIPWPFPHLDVNGGNASPFNIFAANAQRITTLGLCYMLYLLALLSYSRL